MDPRRHKRFLDYRERYTYFGAKGKPSLTYDEFVAAEDELLALEKLGDSRSDEEEARFTELTVLLLRD